MDINSVRSFLLDRLTYRCFGDFERRWHRCADIALVVLAVLEAGSISAASIVATTFAAVSAMGMVSHRHHWCGATIIVF
jgi:hypothetical protein